MTDKEWKEVEKTLETIHKKVVLQIDGYKVALRLQQESTYKNIIVVFVNDRLDVNWLFNECDERKRFFQRKTRYKNSDYEVGWSSFKKLKSHLVKNNKSIELVSCGGY